MKDMNKEEQIITISESDFVDVAAELTARIHTVALERADSSEDLAMVLMVDELLLHFSGDLKQALFKRFRLEIEKEDK